MFSKQPKDSNKSEESNLESLIQSVIQEEKDIEIEEKEPETKSELVINVDKISGIVSPYFIVLIGLLLYEENFLFGTILIIVGILSLLKVTKKDINKLFNWFINFFSGDDN